MKSKQGQKVPALNDKAQTLDVHYMHVLQQILSQSNFSIDSTPLLGELLYYNYQYYQEHIVITCFCSTI